MRGHDPYCNVTVFGIILLLSGWWVVDIVHDDLCGEIMYAEI